MANQRAEGQVLIGFWANAELVTKIDKARGTLGRSQFLREAVAGMLRGKGIKVQSKVVAAPDRSGKGGPRPTAKRKAKR